MRAQPVMAGACEPQRTTQLIPFLNWAGGKRWLVASHANVFPTTYRTYIEPFLGAGSVYFYLAPRHALLGDSNAELVASYQAIQHDWRALVASLRYRQRRHNEDPDYFYWLRDRQPTLISQRASRLIYLNRTCFNGIYRVNEEGRFNVPRGTKDKVLLETDDFGRLARLLQGAELHAGDFEVLIDRAGPGDLVFADPPYTVRHNYNGFRKYNEVLFSWADQERLAHALRRAIRRGAMVVCTNANHQSVRDLYRDFSLKVVSRFSRISGDSKSRRYFDELLVRSKLPHPLPRIPKHPHPRAAR